MIVELLGLSCIIVILPMSLGLLRLIVVVDRVTKLANSSGLLLNLVLGLRLGLGQIETEISLRGLLVP